MPAVRGLWLTMALVVTAAVAILATAPTGLMAADEPKPGAKAEADAKPEAHAPAASHGGHEAAHKAPRSLFEGFLDLTIWSIVVFLLLFFVLSKFAWKPMLDGLQKREDNIRRALEEAEKARDEAKTHRDQLQKELAHAAEKVRAMLEEARRDASHTAEEILSKARAEAQVERERARREIEVARDHALHDIWQQTVDIATAISAKAIRRELTGSDHRRLIEESLAELGQANVNFADKLKLN